MRQIREVVVVEGARDRDRVRIAADADVIVTGGSRIAADVYERLARAAAARGLIILTDPDAAGEAIRRRLSARFPGARHAFVPREAALAGGDVGIENASPEAIAEALRRVRTLRERPRDEFLLDDMLAWGLAGGDRAAARRARVGALLSIGYANARTFLRRLNELGVTREEFADAVRALDGAP